MLVILSQTIQLESDVLVARQRARQIAALLGFDAQQQTRIATAVSEIVRNAFQYAGGGRIEFLIDEVAHRQLFMVRIIDKGQGIPDLAGILKGDAKPKSGVASGLIGARRLMDQFRVESSEAGTTIYLGKFFAPGLPPITGPDIGRIATELAKHAPQSPFEEIQQQNQELMQALNEIRQAHDLLESRVEERTAQLAQVNETLRAEIFERQQAEEEVHRLNTELEHRVVARTAQLQLVNKELEAFSYSVSHDLRAPLRNINGFSKLLLEDHLDQLDADGQELLNDIRATTLQMGQLIEHMLALAKVTRAEMSVSTVDLSRLAHNALTTLQSQHPERTVEVSIQDSLTVQGDLLLLDAALGNLLGNAWKFTQKKSESHIEFGATHRDGETIYFVRDNGAGFNMKYVSKLFTPFQRLHRLSDFEGTGVGLATVYRIINRHNGRIWAEGTVGEGATFYFTLPASADSVSEALP